MIEVDEHEWESIFGGTPYEIEDLVLIGDRGFTLGVPYSSDPDFRKKVFAAAKAHYMGIKIDYALKRYGQFWDFPEPGGDTVLIGEVASDVRRAIRDALRVGDSRLRGRGQTLGRFAATNALVRLEASFRSTLLLVRNGFFFEAAACARMILEQLAWIVAVHEVDDDSFLRKYPQACIGDLKRILPYAGRLYGALSEAAHILPHLGKQYLDLGSGNAKIVLASTERAKVVAYYLLALVDAFEVVTDVVTLLPGEKSRNVEVSSEGRATPLADRPSERLLREYEERLLGPVPDERSGDR